MTKLVVHAGEVALQFNDNQDERKTIILEELNKSYVLAGYEMPSDDFLLTMVTEMSEGLLIPSEHLRASFQKARLSVKVPSVSATYKAFREFIVPDVVAEFKEVKAKKQKRHEFLMQVRSYLEHETYMKKHGLLNISIMDPKFLEIMEKQEVKDDGKEFQLIFQSIRIIIDSLSDENMTDFMSEFLYSQQEDKKKVLVKYIGKNNLEPLRNVSEVKEQG